MLRRVLARAKKMGFEVKVGFEYEFFVFAETAHSIREKGYRNLKPISPGFFGYSVLRNSVLRDWYKDLLAMCETMDMGIEGLHTETGAGVLEAALRVSDGARGGRQGGAVQALHQGAGAEARLARHLHGQMVEGLAGLRRPHAHVAVEGRQAGLLRREGAAPHEHDHAPVRRRPAGADAGDCWRWWRSTVNAYRRLIPGFWAPTVSTWGVENRTTALRVIPGSAKSTRVEYRVAAADANPYLALAAAVGSGLWGIENKVDPGEPVKGNSYEKKHPAKSAAAAHADGGGGAPESLEGGARAVRRRLRRSLFCNA